MKLVRELLSSKKFLAMLSAIIVYGVGRFGFDITPEKLSPFWEAILVYVGAQGAADIGKSAAQVRAARPMEIVTSPDFKTPTGGSVLPLAIAGLAFGALIAVPSCAEVRPRLAAGAAAFVDCEDANLKAATLEAYELAEAKLLTTIAGNGTVDATLLKAALSKVKSDGLRCAIAAAVAVIATPKQQGLMAAPESQLPAAFAAASAELGWPTYRVAR